MQDKIGDIFSRFEQKNNQISINQVQTDLKKYDILLYGAGSAGIAFLHYLRDNDIFPLHFIDGSPKKWGTVCEGLQVLSIADAAARFTSTALVIVTINTDGTRYCKSFDEALRQGGHTGVHKSLHEAGFTNVIDYTFFRRCYALFQNDEYNLPSCSDIACMLANKQKITDTYNMLYDDESRDIFSKIVEFRMIDDSIVIPTLTQENQYFEYSIYNKIVGESFVDCGAFNGITLKAFLQNNAQFKKYYAFEPDAVNFKLLKEYINTLPKELADKIELSQKGTYDINGKKALYALDGPGSFVSELGKSIIDTVTIDDALDGRECTFIKMNIEGSEAASLRGATKTISTQNPSMAIAGYHKTWDLWEIPMFVSKLSNKYKIHLRSYMNHISFVYYFISDER
ncbi:MAG: FkbM family methyltransferase [Oscillospiraceae bacterium]